MVVLQGARYWTAPPSLEELPILAALVTTAGTATLTLRIGITIALLPRLLGLRLTRLLFLTRLLPLLLIVLMVAARLLSGVGLIGISHVHIP